MVGFYWIDIILVLRYFPNSVLERLEELEYSHVTLTGHFDHSKELHIWPRTLLTSGGPLARRNTEGGACVVTPFYCQELGGWVLVNRGWVATRKMDPNTRLKGQVNSWGLLGLWLGR